ncbi:MAG: ATP-binding protein [Candidatus Thorarchaeota archaeon]|jgi:hypothetical protein
MKFSDSPSIKIDGSLSDVSYKARISEKNMHKLWDILQDPYKNPIGAIVREYTSNAWDAHVEAANLEDPIIVEIAKDESGWYWSVEDFGVGMSEERIREVFVEYLETTKDLSNDEIGAFGIGSKSGLSYTELVHYRTRHQGTEYNYLLRKGEEAPVLDLISKQSTDDQDGTYVKVYIKESYRSGYSRKEPETWKFKEQCKQQLPYFHNVFFKGCDIDNNYKIYEGDHFKVSTLISTANMHMCIGDVYYPIDWEQMKMTEIKVAVGLKFNIGDLDLQFTREDVKYSQRTKDAIKGKIDDVKDELLVLYHSGENMEKEDVFDYYEMLRSDPVLTIEGINIAMVAYKDELKNIARFKPMKDMHVPAMDNFFTDYRISREVSNSGSAAQPKYDNNVAHPMQNVWRSTNSGSAPHSYRPILYYITGPNNPRKNRKLRTDTGKGIKVALIRKNNPRLKAYVDVLRLNSVDKSKWRDSIIAYQNAQRAMIDKYCGQYADIELEVEEEGERFNYRAYRKSNQLIFTQIVNSPTYGDHSYTTYFTKSDIPLRILFGNTGIMIYGAEDDKEDLRQVAAMFANADVPYAHMQSYYNEKRSGDIKLIHGKTREKARFTVLYIAKQNWKYLPQHHNCMHVKDLINKSNMKLFGQICTARKMHKSIPGALWNVLYSFKERFEIYDYCHPDVFIKAERVHKFINKYGHSSSWYEPEFLDEAVEACEKIKNFDYDILSDLEWVVDYMTGLNIINDPYIFDQADITTNSKMFAMDTVQLYNWKHKDDLKKVKMINSEYYHGKHNKIDDDRVIFDLDLARKNLPDGD